MNHHMTEAVVFVLTAHLLPDADRCIRHCLSRGYHVVGIVKDNWAEAMRMLHDGRAEVLVVADEQHLDPERAPRIEVVGRRPGAKPGPRSERSQMVKRNAATPPGPPAAGRR